MLSPTNREKRTLVRGPLYLFLIVISLTLVYQFGERWLRSLLLYLSGAYWARELISQLPFTRQVAFRFVAGEDIDAAMAATKELNAKGMIATTDYLGEHITNPQDAVDARDEILNLLDNIRMSGVDANVSVKLSQLGVNISQDLALANMRYILTRARQHGNRIRIDMEESKLVDTTLGIYRTLRDKYGFDNVGVVIQAYLYRSEADVRQLIREGAWVRLCKGAYAEPPQIAFPDKDDTDANFVKLMQMMLGEDACANGVYLGVATHDDAMIQATIDYVKAHDISLDAFEFQMLYGIRRELQEALVQQGYRLRIYVPYGTAWYPYFVRRLAERPANLWFFLSNLFRA